VGGNVLVDAGASSPVGGKVGTLVGGSVGGVDGKPGEEGFGSPVGGTVGTPGDCAGRNAVAPVGRAVDGAVATFVGATVGEVVGKLVGRPASDKLGTTLSWFDGRRVGPGD